MQKQCSTVAILFDKHHHPACSLPCTGACFASIVGGPAVSCHMLLSASMHICLQGPVHQRVIVISRIILGDDMAFDFDMLISKVCMICIIVTFLA